MKEEIVYLTKPVTVQDWLWASTSHGNPVATASLIMSRTNLTWEEIMALDVIDLPVIMKNISERIKTGIGLSELGQQLDNGPEAGTG